MWSLEHYGTSEITSERSASFWIWGQQVNLGGTCPLPQRITASSNYVCVCVCAKRSKRGKAEKLQTSPALTHDVTDVPTTTPFHRWLVVWCGMSSFLTGWPKNGKPGILRHFSKHGKLRKYSGKNCNKQSILVRRSNIWSECGGDLLYCWSWCGMTLDEGHYYIYFLLQ